MTHKDRNMENSMEHKLGEKDFMRQEALEWDRTAKSTFLCAWLLSFQKPYLRLLLLQNCCQRTFSEQLTWVNSMEKEIRYLNTMNWGHEKSCGGIWWENPVREMSVLEYNRSGTGLEMTSPSVGWMTSRAGQWLCLMRWCNIPTWTCLKSLEKWSWIEGVETVKPLREICRGTGRTECWVASSDGLLKQGENWHFMVWGEWCAKINWSVMEMRRKIEKDIVGSWSLRKKKIREKIS